MEMALSPVCDSAVSPWLHVCLAFLHKHFPLHLLPQVLLSCLPAVNSKPCPGIAFQSLCSSSQLLHFLGDVCPCPEYIWLQQGLFVWLSFHLDCHRSAASLSNSLKCFTSSHTVVLMWGIWPLLQFLYPPEVNPVLLSFFLPSFLCPIEFCIVLYILFWWSGTPVHSQLVSCKIFCVWRCIPDVSMERDVLHITYSSGILDLSLLFRFILLHIDISPTTST